MTQSSRVLATRCPHCHTVFRVVADQLKLRDGLVRCGHCREVFDGRAYLCDPPAEEHETPVSHGVAAPSNAAAHESAPVASNATSSPAAGSASGSDKPIPEMLTPTAIAALLGTPDESRAQMQHGPGRYMDDVDDDPTVLSAPTATPSRIETSSPHRSEAQRRPGAARAIWRVLMALAVVGLLGQWAWIERAALVDRVPALRGVFAAIGKPLHVTIGLPRVPDQIQISSVTLVTDTAGSGGAVDGDDAAASAVEATASDAVAASDAPAPTDAVPMTLTVFVRNQADYALAWPSLELTLSDLDGKPVVRRVFSANEYVTGASMREAGLAPRSERTIRLRLSAQAALASNYRVLAFYP
jgi:predicted Zn finger-like uncharacterized protein